MKLMLWHKPSHKQLVVWKEQNLIQGILCVLTDREVGDILTSEQQRFKVWQHKYTIKKSAQVPKDMWPIYRAELDAVAIFAVNSPVLIHCAAGIHRTGVNAYALFRRAGLNRDYAYKEVCKLRPESADCIRFLDWADEHLL